ncbi:MAG: type II toxin-antitoxin system Phd/YefM family antitoxin [Gaiellaceae bacterium]
MTEMINVGEAKRRFSELIDRVAAGERFIVARRGRPVLALVPAEAVGTPPNAQLGLAAFAGALDDWPELDEVMADVVASRAETRDRPAPQLD